MIVGNRERDTAPTTFTISKAVEPAVGADAAVIEQLQTQLDALTQKASTTTGPTVRDVENLKSQIEALSFQMGDVVGKMRTDLSKVTTDLSRVTSSPAPVGTIISSSVTSAKFQAEYGTFSTTSIWMVADGRDVTGSEYARISGITTVPDLRGAFLRGSATSTRAGATGWAGGTQNTYVEDSTRLPRSTEFRVEVQNPIRQGRSGRGISGSASYASGEAYLYPGTSSEPITGGDTETRPKHYVVNYYIRIN